MMNAEGGKVNKFTEDSKKQLMRIGVVRLPMKWLHACLRMNTMKIQEWV